MPKCLSYHYIVNYTFNLIEIFPLPLLTPFHLILILLCCVFVPMHAWYVIFCTLLLIFLYLKDISDWPVLWWRILTCSCIWFFVGDNQYSWFFFYFCFLGEKSLSLYGIYFVIWKIYFLFSIIPIIIFINIFQSKFIYF